MIILAVLILFGGVAFIIYGQKPTGTEIATSIKNEEPQQATATKETIEETAEIMPLREEDIIRRFFEHINENRIPEAIKMMSTTMAPDDSTKQAWGVQFNDIEKIGMLGITPSSEDSWLDDYHQYKVTLNVDVNESAKDLPIPYYGWEDSPNVRWVSIVKENYLWKISEIATGQ